MWFVVRFTLVWLVLLLMPAQLSFAQEYDPSDPYYSEELFIDDFSYLLPVEEEASLILIEDNYLPPIEEIDEQITYCAAPVASSVPDCTHLETVYVHVAFDWRSLKEVVENAENDEMAILVPLITKLFGTLLQDENGNLPSWAHIKGSIVNPIRDELKRETCMYGFIHFPPSTSTLTISNLRIVENSDVRNRNKITYLVMSKSEWEMQKAGPRRATDFPNVNVVLEIGTIVVVTDTSAQEELVADYPGASTYLSNALQKLIALLCLSDS